MFCPKCGTELNGTPSFCPECGADLRDKPVYTVNTEERKDTYAGDYSYSGGYKVNINERSIGINIFLSIITCGIYGIVWFVQLVDDLNAACGKTDEKGGGIVFLLSLITCGIYSLVWMYQAGEKVNAVRAKNCEAPDTILPILYLVLNFFGLGIVSICLIQSELNKVAAVRR